MPTPLNGPLTSAQQADLRTVQLPDRLIVKGLNHRSNFARFARELAAGWTASGEISQPKAGFGFATSGVVSMNTLMRADLEDLRTYIAAAFTDGNVPERYMWNAVRKIYELLRLLQAGHNLNSTLEAVRQRPEILRPSVPSENPDGTVPWGPFSKGGAVILRRRGMAILCAFSVWTQEEDGEMALKAAEWLLNLVVPA